MRIFIADIDQDIDDLIAIEFLKLHNSIDGVVLDPLPISSLGLKRVDQIKRMKIRIFDEIPSETKVIFNGGAFTKLAEFLERHTLDAMIANGGFVGDNIVKAPLEKFRGKQYCRTYNFNLDVTAADKVLKSKNIKMKYLVSKNVCHDIKNTVGGIWKGYEFLAKYNLKDTKRLHDLLMCSEGMRLLNGEDTLLIYEWLTPVNTGLKGKYTEWGSVYGKQVIGSVGYKT